MNKLKKLGSLLLALVLAIGMTGTALADSTAYTAVSQGPYIITIDKTTEGYTYKAYQIFTGDLSLKTEVTNEGTDDEETTETLVLSNVVFGSALSDDDQDALLTYYATVLSSNNYASSAAGLAEALANDKIDVNDFAEKVAGYVAAYDPSTGTESVYDAGEEEYTITVTSPGYYLVVNTGIADATSQSYSNYIVEVVSDVKVSTKDDSIPIFDKEVTSTTDEEQESTADYDVDDDVPFTLTATLPKSYDAFDTYKLVFHDTLSDGLNFNENSVVVTVTDTSGTEPVVTVVDSGYTVVTGSDLTDTCTFDVVIADTNALYDADENLIPAAKDYIITVTYTAELTSEAENVEFNNAYLEYSNNPNGSETGTTTNDKTYVVTFTLNVDKTDGTDPLEGAGFTLYKYDDDEDDYVAVGSEITDVTTFTFDGLAIGDYKLSETTTPTGYNTADDLYFTIDADTSENEGTNVPSVTVTIYAADGENVLNTDEEGATFTVSSQTISTTVVNNEGAILPSTGGIGTTIFYVVGGILVVGAVVLLITRVRMRDDEE